jgi:hypothetical protein
LFGDAALWEIKQRKKRTVNDVLEFESGAHMSRVTILKFIGWKTAINFPLSPLQLFRQDTISQKVTEVDVLKREKKISSRENFITTARVPCSIQRK